MYSRSDAHIRMDRRTESKLGIDLGTDVAGRSVAAGVCEYAHLLLKRGVKLNSLIVLGSRAKNRAKQESDVDVMIIASNLKGRNVPGLTNIPQKILGIRRWFLLSDAPISMGIQPSGECSKEEFLRWLKEFRILALDAVCYGKVIYDDGFWDTVLVAFDEIKEKYRLAETTLKEMLFVL
jgi:predicted nucleotidyltransferase